MSPYFGIDGWNGTCQECRDSTIGICAHHRANAAKWTDQSHACPDCVGDVLCGSCLAWVRDNDTEAPERGVRDD